MPMTSTNHKPWKFFEYVEGEKRRDSSSQKHFTGLGINESLIRELIQNSLDAVSDKNQAVEIKIRFTEINISDYEQYFQGLEPHYKACYEKSIANEIREKVKFLIIEDFNTTGLEGEKETDFFQKDNIRSDSSNSSGGSHGIGKIVFYLASKIATFFAFSIHENGRVFQASCDFKTHELGGKEYKEDGRLFLFPEKDKHFIEALFTRTGKQKGLSIAIPLPDDKLAEEKLKEAVVEEYYYPVMNEKLIVNLGPTSIDPNYIFDQKGEKQELISEYFTVSEKKYLRIDIGETYRDKDKFLSPQQEEQIISRLESDDRIVIRFHFLVKLKGKRNPKAGYLDLLMSRKGDKQDSKFDFWREYLLIKEAVGRGKSSSHYTVIVLIHGEANELSQLLRRLENPSHTRWDYNNPADEVKNEYQYIRQLVPFVTRLPNKLIHFITNAGIKLDSNFFSDLFPDTSTRGGASDKGQASGDTDNEKPSGIHSNPNFDFRENRRNNGFILSLSAAGKQEGIARLSITVAYGTNKGNPFKNYDSRDFDLQRNIIKIELDGGKEIERKENRVLCQIKNKDDFKITLSGFDPDRELKIDANEESE